MRNWLSHICSFYLVSHSYEDKKGSNETMAIASYTLAASSLPPAFEKQRLQSFIETLLQEHYVTLPAAVFVGEARNQTDPTTSHHWKYIVPNSPDSMLSVMN